MNSQDKNKKHIKSFLLSILIFLVCQPLAYADEIIKVAILPFRINSAENMDYLKKGIFDMLASRVSMEGKVVVIENERVKEVLSQIPDGPITEEAVRKIGIDLDADFLISGSLTKIGQSVSIDAKMLEMKEKKSVTSLFATSKGMDNVIPKISEFGLKANARITGKSYSIQEAPPPTASSQASAFLSEFLVPKKKRENGVSSGVSSDFIKSGDPTNLRRGFWKSQRLELEIKGVDIGDVDGDGKNETVVLENGGISIYRYSNNRLVLVKNIQGRGIDEYLSLDVADINKNGISEIFVTNLIDRELNSFVIEFHDEDFRKIAADIGYFLKVIDTSQMGSMLVGQKVGSNGGFYGSVRQLVWKDKKYVEERRVPLPSSAIVYGFNLIDVDKDGKEEVVLVDNDDHLRVYSGNGELMWKSDGIYGGTNNFIAKYPDSSEPNSSIEDLVSRLYIQNRVLVQNHKGENEVIVIKNIPSAGKIFERVRMYRESEIYNLVWDGLGLSENWRTKKIHGYIADFQIKDIDNDGKDELVVGIVQASLKSIFKGAKSYVLAYDLVM